MNRIPMTEPTARFTSVAACGLSLFAAVAAIVLGTRQLQAQAALFLALAFIGCLITVISYRRYAALRKQRWHTELAGTEDELNQAKSKIASRLVRHSERPMGRMRSIASAWMYNGEYHDIDAELARFDAVTLAAVRDCLDRYPLDKLTVVAYGPLEKL